MSGEELHPSPTLREWLESAPIQKIIDGKTLRYQVINADEVLALLDERDALRAQVERVRALADALRDVHPQPSPQHTDKAIRDALDGPQ